jgi:hypothetical protein
MKRMMVVGLAVVLSVSCAEAQFKSQVGRESRPYDGPGGNSSTSFLFGWFNPDKFHMRHSFSMSYMTSAGQGLSLGTYTNSMMYEFADNLNAQADVSLSYSPFNSFSKFGNQKNDLSGIYLSRAEVNYKPWENVTFQLQYQKMPYYWGYYGSPFYSPFYGDIDFQR